MATILGYIEVCDDCLVMHANDEVVERPEGEPQPWSAMPTADVAMACETDDEGDETCGFSHRDCDGCGSTLGGTRHRMAVFAWEAFPTRGHWSACTADCNDSNCQTIN